jgi:GTP-binding protein
MIKFADEVTIEVCSGKGGNGSVAFRREKFIPKGGPAGGDGGKGGDVVFQVKRNLRTLAHLRFKRNLKAEGGQDGMGKNMHGRDGADIVIPVPPGTRIMDAETGEILKDFSEREEPWVFLKGGKGGWGNVHFKNSVNQAPMYAHPGKPSLSAKLRVELNIMADIGFVGFPNAGKSSLLDAFTNARPKIAPYPFTTKIPNLGVLTINERDIILADIPGIIEGAHDGAGLGIRFLKHISRTAGLAFLIDCSEPDCEKAFPILLDELTAFSADLAKKPRVVIGTKLDLEGSQEAFEALASKLPGERVYGISVFSGQGLDALRSIFFDFVAAADADTPAPDDGKFMSAPEGTAADFGQDEEDL